MKFGADAVGSPSLPKSPASAPGNLVFDLGSLPITEEQVAEIGQLTRNCVARFIEHFRRNPSDTEISMLFMAAVRYALEPGAHPVVQ